MYKHRTDSPQSVLVDAVETLSSIADLDFNKQHVVAEEQELNLQNSKIQYKSVKWLGENTQESRKVIKNIFKVVLRYLKRFYKHEYRRIGNQNAMEEIKTIMVLVGEAAKKLDMQQKSSKKLKKITDLKEYRALQKFYKERIARKIDEGILGKWILSISQVEKAPEVPKDLSDKEFISLQGVKRDVDYELFYMRKESGSRFYQPRVVRNMKLVSDFGAYFGSRQLKGELVHLPFAIDSYYCDIANHLLKSAGRRIRGFLELSVAMRKKSFLKDLNSAVIALMLAANPRNKKRNDPIKTCEAYFRDFQVFLRKSLSTKAYQKQVVYGVKKEVKEQEYAFELIETLCYCMNKSLNGFTSFNNYMERVVEEALELKEFVDLDYEKKPIWRCLLDTYTSMTSSVKQSLKGPIHKVLEDMELKQNNTFDPFIQGNLPNSFIGLYYKDKKIDILHMPCPTHQEKINKANITEEFLAYLRKGKKYKNKTTHLMFNLQDNTERKGYARAKAVEDLSEAKVYNEQLEVVTLPKNTAFYHQIEPYHKDNQAKNFINHLKEQITGESTGFYFSKKCRKNFFLNG